jgi:hypothetical protein
MARILFVTGNAGGVGLGNLQYRGAIRKSNGGSRNVLDTSPTRSERSRDNHLEELRSFPTKTEHNRPRNLRLSALQERENHNMRS